MPSRALHGCIKDLGETYRELIFNPFLLCESSAKVAPTDLLYRRAGTSPADPLGIIREAILNRPFPPVTSLGADIARRLRLRV